MVQYNDPTHGGKSSLDKSWRIIDLPFHFEIKLPQNILGTSLSFLTSGLAHDMKKYRERGS